MIENQAMTWSMITRQTLLALALVSVSTAVARNGFDLSETSIPVEEILPGGPPRDGIPAIDAPNFVPADQVNWLQSDELVIGVVRAGIAKAYPIRILNWHEIVNDEFNGEPVLVTFCPLCGTGVVFTPPDGSGFGVSGLLYNSDVLLYDRATESLWSQILGEAVSGAQLGTRLTVLPSRHTSWEQWSADHPDTLVLNRITGFTRDYSRNPYQGYRDTEQVFFPLANISDADIHPKERVLGLTINGVTKAYPFSALSANGQASFVDEINGTAVSIHWDANAPTAWATTADGEELPGVDAFWFAWFAFHPDTLIFTP